MKNDLALNIDEEDADDIDDELPNTFPEYIMESFNVYILLATLAK